MIRTYGGVGGRRGQPRLLPDVRPAGRIFKGVKVSCRPGRGNYELNGKGVHREVESEGSRRQSADLTNRNRIEAFELDEGANTSKVQYLTGKLGRICGRYKREGRCALPGEICRSALCY